MSGQSKAPARQRAPNVISHTKKMTGYRFIEKDPVLDLVIGRIIEVVINQGRSPEWIERETEKIGRKVSASTVIGWLYGGTKRPQNYTLESVMLALGARRIWLDISSGAHIEAPETLIIPPRKRKRRPTALLSPPEAQKMIAPVSKRAVATKSPSAKGVSKRAPRAESVVVFSWDRQDVIDRVFQLHGEGQSAPQIAHVIAKEFNTRVLPSGVKGVLTYKSPSTAKGVSQ